MNELPVREMVLYKHGVGFFVRQGTVSGENVALTFHHDEINDVLKSLAVFDRSGGMVLGIHYPTPMDTDARLSSSSIRLSDRASLRDLLRDLRGRKVELTFEATPGTVEAITGRMIGLDQVAGEQETGLLAGDPVAAVLVSALAEDGQVYVFRLDALRALRVHDAQSEHDLSYFLDTSMAEDTRRAVTVRLSEGQHDLVIHYVAPSPTWRVSYRVVAESASDGETGKALLQGWGLFDNRLEEDLDDVRVTLVAGQPISFIYELYASRIPQRPTVQDEARIAPGPIEYEGADFLAAAEADDDERARGIMMAKTRAGMFAGGARATTEAPRFAYAMQDARFSMPAPAKTRDAGEFFQYEVTTPVSVKRGESALVPIIGSDIKYNRELLYNKQKFPDHPVAALRLMNSTGLTLERGPVTVVEDGDYKGEAVVPFTKDGNEVYLPFAVELGVKITERAEDTTVLAGLVIDQGYFVEEHYRIESVTYIIENSTSRPLTITIEAPLYEGRELFETRPPDVETAEYRRWQMNVPVRRKVEFTRKERWLTRRSDDLRKLDYKRLQSYMEQRWLDKAALDSLSEMLDQFAFIQRLQNEREELTKERKALYDKQEQLRANLGALNPSGQEAAFRNRILSQLEAAQDRIEQIEQRLESITQQVTDALARVDQIIAALG